MRRTFAILLLVSVLMASAVSGWAIGGSGTIDPPPRIAFLANGINPADAVAAGGMAGQLGAPLFTTRPDELEPAAEAGIVAYAPELVIVLGGSVAIADSVLARLADATGLSVHDSGTPTSGIVRAAGEDRFATAAVVAALLGAYDPAYLRVDATALGAVDADLLDGLDATAFARADSSCASGRFATGIDKAGRPTCASPDGGNADQLDGLDGSQLLTAQPYTVQITELIGADNGGADPVVRRRETAHLIESPDSSAVSLNLPVVLSGRGFAAVEVLDVTVCVDSGAALIGGAAYELVDSETGEFYWTDAVQGATFADDSCTVVTPQERYILDASVFPNINIRMSAGALRLRTISARLRPTNDPVNRDGPLEF